MLLSNKTGNKTRAPLSIHLTFVHGFLDAGETPDEAVEGFLPSDSVVGIVAPSQSGKSLLVMQLAGCVATGYAFSDVTASKVWWFIWPPFPAEVTSDPCDPGQSNATSPVNFRIAARVLATRRTV